MPDQPDGGEGKGSKEPPQSSPSRQVPSSTPGQTAMAPAWAGQ